MTDEIAARVRGARERLTTAGLATAAADRLVVQFLALAQHLGDARPLSDAAGFAAVRDDLSAGPGHRDRSLLADGPDPAEVTPAWPAVVDLLAPAVPRDPAALGAARAALLGDRKRSGSFYTRPALARAVACRTLAPWLAGPEPPALCDPAMGCGALLLAALALLAGRFRVGPTLAGLHGVDVDPLAVDLARWNLWRAAGAPRTDLGLADRLVCGDSLIGAWLAPGAVAVDIPPGFPSPAPQDSRRAAPSPVPADSHAASSPVPADSHAASSPVLADSHTAASPVPADSHAAASPVPADSRAAASPVPADSLRAALDRRVAGLTARPLHWQRAFPAVFAGPAPGFAAVLANPPWDALKPSAREFLAGHGRDDGDPADDPALAPAWRAHRAALAARARWFTAAYRHQGRSDRNTYKLFVERCLQLLRPGGALGLLVPAGIYSDHQCAGLRRLLLTTCRWTHLYAFQNERFVFPGVDHRTKIAFVGATRGGATDVLHTRFRLGPGDAPTPAAIATDLLADAGYLARPIAALQAASPTSLAIAELRDERSAAVFAAVQVGTEPAIGGAGWGVRHTREFDMSRDAALFPAVAAWEARGYRADEYGHWLAGDWRADTGGAIRSRDGGSSIDPDAVAAIAVPLLQGAQIHQHTATAAAWRCGTGVRATWDPLPGDAPRFAPQYLIARADARRSRAGARVRVGVREVCRSTDTRTLIAAVLPPFPAGHKVPNLLPGDGSPVQALALAAELNSLCVDHAARARLGASSLTAAFLADTPLGAPRPARALAPWAARLGLTHPRFAPLWLDPELRAALPDRPWRDLWAVTPHERLRLRCMLDALVAHRRGLPWSTFAELVAGCDYPAAALRRSTFTRRLDPKGFWRVDRDRDPELRLPILALVAYRDLCAAGLAAFLAGDGWPLPASLRLADLGLGHDDRARAAQPVAARLGPACPEGQVDPRERGWDACARHAATLARLDARD